MAGPQGAPGAAGAGLDLTEVTGRVVMCSGTPAGTLVYIPGLPFNVFTNSSGQFSFLYVPAPTSGGGYDLGIVVSGQAPRVLTQAVSFVSGDTALGLGDILLSDVTSDPNNCGACGNVCQGGFTCTNSACVPGPPTQVCGDGTVQAPEACDDGNLINGDGCSATCTIEPSLLANGAACGADSQCGSNFCTDGVCSNQRCGGTCQTTLAAKGATADGICTVIPFGADPDAECNASGSGVCAAPGVCNGAGACVGFPAAGTVCGAAFCSSNTVLNSADFCDGAGTCLDGGTEACSPYTCNVGACSTSCTTDTQCAAGNVCSSGTCRLVNGAACNADSQCGSSFCTDGVCSNARCGGLCQAANIAGSIGTCTNIPNGQDPAAECAGTTTCNGNGACTSDLLIADTCSISSSYSCARDQGQRTYQEQRN